jgi:hypothetical protein
MRPRPTTRQRQTNDSDDVQCDDDDEDDEDDEDDDGDGIVDGFAGFVTIVGVVSVELSINNKKQRSTKHRAETIQDA